MDHENLTSSNDKKVNLCAFTFYQYVKEYMDLFKFLIELHSRYLHIWPCLGKHIDLPPYKLNKKYGNIPKEMKPDTCDKIESTSQSVMDVPLLFSD